MFRGDADGPKYGKKFIILNVSFFKPTFVRKNRVDFVQEGLNRELKTSNLLFY